MDTPVLFVKHMPKYWNLNILTPSFSKSNEFGRPIFKSGLHIDPPPHPWKPSNLPIDIVKTNGEIIPNETGYNG